MPLNTKKDCRWQPFFVKVELEIIVQGDIILISRQVIAAIFRHRSAPTIADAEPLAPVPNFIYIEVSLRKLYLLSYK